MHLVAIGLCKEKKKGEESAVICWLLPLMLHINMSEKMTGESNIIPTMWVDIVKTPSS